MKRTMLTVQTIATTLLFALVIAGCSNSAPTASTEAAPAQATMAPEVQVAATAVTTAAAAMNEAAPMVAKLNLNTATDAELLAVPGVTDRMLREFKEYRPYVSIQQFRRELGKYVDEAQVTAYEQYVFVPIDINESDEATLQQISGVDAAVAAQLVVGRPYASQQAFLDALKAQVAAADLSVATSYLVAE